MCVCVSVCVSARGITGFGEVLVGAAEVGGVTTIGDFADVLGCPEHKVTLSWYMWTSGTPTHAQRWHGRTVQGRGNGTGKLFAEVKAGVRDAAARVLLFRLPRKHTAT